MKSSAECLKNSAESLKGLAACLCYNTAHAVPISHGIIKELILNLDQTPLPCVSPGKHTFNSKGAKAVPIKGIDDMRQITETFTVSMTATFLPVQLIYEGKTRRCLP